ncbi:UNVERIFIED_CONTAM: hypothetical protein GTU68_052536 [Idotea baltica]|nr:hypothetical protein [Idotea baltica]
MDNENTKVEISQIKSTNGRTQKVKDTLQTLGLGRIGRSRVHVLSATTIGKIRKIKHLVKVKKI